MIVKSNRKTKRYSKKTRKKVKTVKILSPEQIKMIYEVQNQRDRAILTLLLHTGLRVGELHNLNYGDSFQPGLKKVKDFILVIGKGNKERLIPVNNDARKALRSIDRYNRRKLRIKFLSQRVPLLISRNGNRLSISMIEKMCKKKLGAHPHVFRHTFLTFLRETGIRLEVLQRLAGHASIETTSKFYVSVSTEDLKAAVQKIETRTPPELKLVQIA